MRPLRKHTGIVVPLDRQNVDTDQIIPKQFLKRIERTGYGEFLFFNCTRIGVAVFAAQVAFVGEIPNNKERCTKRHGLLYAEVGK